MSQEDVQWPEKINVDGNSATHRGLRLLAMENRRWQDVEIRARRYPNNVVEAGPSCHQAVVRADAGPQEFSLGGDHARRSRTRPSGSQAAVFAAERHEGAGRFAEGIVGRGARRFWRADAPGRGPTCVNAPELSGPFSAGARALMDRHGIHRRSPSAEACTCSSGPKAGGTGTTTTATAESGRRFHSGPIRARNAHSW